MKFKLHVFSLLFFLFCSCEKGEGNRFKVIAHRGYWKVAEGADNSILGLKEAARFGADGVEFDVCKTNDDSLLVVHGPYHGGYYISNTDYETLRSVKLSDGEWVPTLNEYLVEAIKYNLIYFIELKTRGEEELVLKTLDRYGYRYKVKLCSFDFGICETLLDLDSKLYVSYINGDKAPAELKAKGYSGIHYDIDVFRKHIDWIKEGRLLELEVSAWVVKTESDIIWCSVHGIEYLIADNPLEAIQFRSNYE